VARCLGLRCTLCDPYVRDGFEKSLGVERAETFAELLRASHFLTFHCPLTSETRRMLNGESIEMLPRGAYVINTSRGAVINGDDLVDAVRSGQLAGAAID